MTLYHFGNCMALVYIPYYLTYKFSGMSEYRSFWKCLQSGGIYIFTQLCKMILLATFFPDTNNYENYNLFYEFLKSTVDLLDLVGIYLVLWGIPGKGHAKLFTAALGWSGAEIILTRFIFLWVGAREAEFDWTYIQSSLDANVNLIHHITTATLVWLWSRHDLNRSWVPIVICLLILTSYKPFILHTFVHSDCFGHWIPLLVKTLLTLGIGIATLQIYSGLAQSIGIF